MGSIFQAEYLAAQCPLLVPVSLQEGCPARLGRSHATSLWPPPSPQDTRPSLPPPCPSQTQTKGPQQKSAPAHTLTSPAVPRGCLNLNGEGNGLAMAPWHQDENSGPLTPTPGCSVRSHCLRNTREGQAFKSSHSVALSLRRRRSAEAYEATQPWLSSSCHSCRAGPGVRQTKVPSSTASIPRALPLARATVSNYIPPDPQLPLRGRH